MKTLLTLLICVIGIPAIALGFLIAIFWGFGGVGFESAVTLIKQLHEGSKK